MFWAWIQVQLGRWVNRRDLERADGEVEQCWVMALGGGDPPIHCSKEEEEILFLFILLLLLMAPAFLLNFPVSCLLKLKSIFVNFFCSVDYLGLWDIYNGIWRPQEWIPYAPIVRAILDRTSMLDNWKFMGTRRQTRISLEKQGGIRGLYNLSDAIMLCDLSPAIC